MKNGKSVIKTVIGKLRIVIPSQKNLFVLLFGSFWLIGWTYGLYSVSEILFYSWKNGEIDYFLLVWLVGWLIGGTSVISVLLWNLFGREKLLIGKETIRFQKTVLGIGKRRVLKLEELKNLRKHQVCGSLLSGCRLIPYGLNTGKIRFDYGLKTYSFGLSLDESEVDHILTILEENIVVEQPLQESESIGIQYRSLFDLKKSSGHSFDLSSGLCPEVK